MNLALSVPERELIVRRAKARGLRLNDYVVDSALLEERANEEQRGNR